MLEGSIIPTVITCQQARNTSSAAASSGSPTVSKFGMASRLDPTETLLVHAAPAHLNLEAREETGALLARGNNLLRTADTPVALGLLGHLIPSAALHAITALSIGPVKPLAFLPSPYNGITFVLASFFIGLFTAYLFSKGSGGQGTFLAHLYCLLLCTIPLVTVSGALLLIPATGWLVLLLGSMVEALFIYGMVLHTFTIMAVHRLSAGRATLIVLIIPMMILALVLLVGLFYLLIEGGVDVGDFDVFDIFSWGGKKPRKPLHL